MPKIEFKFHCGWYRMKYSGKSSAPHNNGSFETRSGISNGNKEEEQSERKGANSKPPAPNIHILCA